MSITHISKKMSGKQHLFAGISPSNSTILNNLWFSGDTCTPEDLPIAELKGRLNVHLEQIGELNPQSQEYQKQVAFVKMYQFALILRGA